MCTEHSMLRKNINMGLIHIQANTTAYAINYQGMWCTSGFLQCQMNYNFNKNIL